MIDSISIGNVLVAIIGAVGAILAATLPVSLTRRAAQQQGNANTSVLAIARRRELRAWWLVAALALAVTVLSALQIYENLTQKPVSVKINTPTQNEPVDGQKYAGLDASVESVPPGFEVTIVVYDPRSNRHNPSDKICPVDKAGEIKCTPIYLGADGKPPKPMEFTIQIVAINENAKKAFKAYNDEAVKNHYPGLPTLPPGTLIIGQVGVIRRS